MGHSKSVRSNSTKSLFGWPCMAESIYLAWLDFSLIRLMPLMADLLPLCGNISTRIISQMTHYFMTDFERNIKKDNFHLFWPDVKLLCCYFHFSQVSLNIFCLIALLTTIHACPNTKWIYLFQMILNMLCSLALFATKDLCVQTKFMYNFQMILIMLYSIALFTLTLAFTQNLCIISKWFFIVYVFLDFFSQNMHLLY